ncbi:MAG: 4Fe-4S cluster-binding domain-containing protein [Ignisphaera sp.]
MALSSVASISLVNVEKIPLSFCCSGGIAMAINFIECPLSCTICPWEANLDHKSSQVLNIGLHDIIELVNKYNPDLVMLHGGEPYKKSEVNELVKELNNLHTLHIGMKINGIFLKDEKIRINQISEYVDIVLIELIDYHSNIVDHEELSSFLSSLIREGKHIEIVFVITSNRYPINMFITSMKDLLITQKIPLNILFASNGFSVNEKLSIVDKYRNENIIVQAPLESVAELASTFCISCRNPIIVRQGGYMLRLNIKSDKTCKYCGYKYNVFKFPKRVASIPLTIQLM